jgi:hypothetical protein
MGERRFPWLTRAKKTERIAPAIRAGIGLKPEMRAGTESGSSLPVTHGFTPQRLPTELTPLKPSRFAGN